ncbi:unnamed protein product, partial [Sphacelaria rigidula]
GARGGAGSGGGDTVGDPTGDGEAPEGAGVERWDTQELMRLMEAAVATPDQWDVVAQRVGGGRSPVACMRQFLNLAVEETLAAEL